MEAKGESFEVGRVSLTSLGYVQSYVYAVSHCTEVNSGKLQAEGKKEEEKKKLLAETWTQIIVFKIINQRSTWYTGAGRIWHREENKY